jgi:hypothetical protein
MLTLAFMLTVAVIAAVVLVIRRPSNRTRMTSPEWKVKQAAFKWDMRGR